MINGAESLVRTARAAGIDVCFANPGTTEMPLVLALEAEQGIRTVLCLFEGVVTGAADGYGRIARKPALTLLHLGPGFANGIAYLHDARRARSPIVNLIGEHATWHIAADAPLNSDIESLARPVSQWLHRNKSSEELAGDTARAISAASGYPGRIATLIVPHDAQIGPASDGAHQAPADGPASVEREQITKTIEILKTSRRPLLFLGGEALSSRGLSAAERISRGFGCKLMCETFPKRLERGAPLPGLPRLPYFPEAAIEALAPFDSIILAGALEPVSFFGYPGLPSYLIAPDKRRHALATPFEDVQTALEDIADSVPSDNDLKSSPPPIERPSGRLTLEALALAIATAQPENAIVMDEGNTSSFFYFGVSAGAPPFTMLAQPGGAIGMGPPCATGAAIAAPDRPVINIQADGSAFYTLQALWTQARENLNVTTIICNNGGYRVLGIEMKRAGVSEFSPRLESLISLKNPSPDWVKLAEGMGVGGQRVETAEALIEAIKSAVASPGPHLIEAVLSS